MITEVRWKKNYSSQVSG